MSRSPAEPLCPPARAFFPARPYESSLKSQKYTTVCVTHTDVHRRRLRDECNIYQMKWQVLAPITDTVAMCQIVSEQISPRILALLLPEQPLEDYWTPCPRLGLVF